MKHLSQRLLLFAMALLVLLVMLFLAVRFGGQAFRRWRTIRSRHEIFDAWYHNPAAYADWEIKAGERCGDAPFAFPTDGFIGFLWDDSFRMGHRHQGLDIFGGEGLGVTAVVVAYPGYLTRQDDWKSTVAIYLPEDPLHPGQAVWTYYTHLAAPDGTSYIVDDFPPGTEAQYVEAGTLLGYQGNYSGDPNNPVGIHLHFSIVKPDQAGKLMNELDIRNTLDPSPYLGLNVSARRNWGEVPVCP
ncbi:MAG: hypothetical protein ACOYYS_02475 [Chloroflexota bacterium]